MTRCLPPEVLLEIIKLATDGPIRYIDGMLTMMPFKSIHAANTATQCTKALNTKHSLSLVNRLFWSLSSEFLYEDVWVRHGSEALADVLERSTADEESGFNRLVKRITIVPIRWLKADSDTPELAFPPGICRVLRVCSDVRIIARSNICLGMGETTSFPGDNHDLDGLNFPFLHRIDWSTTRSSFYEFDAIQPTPAFVYSTPSLRTLHLGSDIFPVLPNEQDIMISLPTLTTLSLRSLSTFGVESMRQPIRLRLHLPLLRHLILTRPEAYYNIFDGALLPLAWQLTSLELGYDALFLRHDFLSAMLVTCPGITDLYMPVFTTRAPRTRQSEGAPAFHSVRVVHLHAAPLPTDADLQAVIRAYDSSDEVARWGHLEQHVRGLVGEGTRFEALERIVLLGAEWQDYVSDKRFGPLASMIYQSSVSLEAEDQKVKVALQATSDWQSMANLGPLN